MGDEIRKKAKGNKGSPSAKTSPSTASTAQPQNMAFVATANKKRGKGHRNAKKREEEEVLTTKVKLRTASDVISRLRWDGGALPRFATETVTTDDDGGGSDDNGATNIESPVRQYVIGYDDRINGPMEKPLEDYVAIDAGGDVPEHRIWYFRATTTTTISAASDAAAAPPTQRPPTDDEIDASIVWDRLGRVDRLFQSGNGGGTKSHVDQRTIDHVREAVATMIRLEEERAERRMTRARERARRARKRAGAASTHLGGQNGGNASSVSRMDDNGGESRTTSQSPTRTRPESKAFDYSSDRNYFVWPVDDAPPGQFRWVSIPWYAYSIECDAWTLVDPSMTEVSTGCHAYDRYGDDVSNDCPDHASSIVVKEGSCSCDGEDESGVWRNGKAEQSEKTKTRPRRQRELTVVTWNVLFDLFDDDDDKTCGSGESAKDDGTKQHIVEGGMAAKARKGGNVDTVDHPTEEKEKCNVSPSPSAAMDRWTILCRHLEKTNADVIALQEITPRFVSVIADLSWVRERYDVTACPRDTSSVDPTGVMVLWRRDALSATVVSLCRAGDRNRSIIVALQECCRNEDDDGSNSKRDGGEGDRTETLSEQQSSNVLLLANVHLPADKKVRSTNSDEFRVSDRSLARRKELGSVLGQMQQIEQALLGGAAVATRNPRILQQGRGGVSVKPLVVGDFNTSHMAPDTLMDGCFSGRGINGSDPVGYFVDVWPYLQRRERGEGNVTRGEGCTFDPRINCRAARTRANMGSHYSTPKRIDRMFVGRSILYGGGVKSATMKSPRGAGADLVLQPRGAELLTGLPRSVGAGDRGCHDIEPPSDHFGVCARFDWGAIDGHLPMRGSTPLVPSQTGKAGHNAWAANATPTPDTLLAIVLDDPILLQTKRKFDPLSSVPLPHVTLLNGFVDLASTFMPVLECEANGIAAGGRNCLDLAVQAVEDAIATSLGPLVSTMGAQGFTIQVAEHSLDVLEHASSSTLVSLPTTEGDWIADLYQSLRQTFRICNEQESRFAGKWTPHVSLGAFGSSSVARQEAWTFIHSGRWIAGIRRIQVHALTVFQRDTRDGQFHPVTSIPLARQPRDVDRYGTPRFLLNCGALWSSYMQGICAPLLWEVERSCRDVLASSFGQLEGSVHVVGSHGMGVSLPTQSDLDCVVELRASRPEEGTVRDGTISRKEFVEGTEVLFRALENNRFLTEVGARIELRHPNAATRIRQAGAGLNVLTVRINPSSPSLDLLLAAIDPNGQPVDETSHSALDARADAQVLFNMLHQAFYSAGVWNGQTADAIYSGALRIVKLWAHRRGVYGSAAGFVGGGGWAIWLARITVDGLRSGSLALPNSDLLEDGRVSANHCHAVAAYFFHVASQGTYPLIVTSDNSGKWRNPAQVTESIRLATTRDTIAIVSPSGGNHGRNSTKSTTLALMSELRRASNLLSPRPSSPHGPSNDGLRNVLECQTEEDFIGNAPFLLVLHLSLQAEEIDAHVDCVELESLQGWFLARLLSLVLDLERCLGDPGKIRPLPRLLNVGNQTNKSRVNFVSLIGLKVMDKRELEDFAEKQSLYLNTQLEKESRRFGCVSMQLYCTLLTSEQAMTQGLLVV